jgi:hypothetical protein
MTNIEKALLSNVFPHVELSLLEEVIDATPSSSVAVEILCGIYLEPEMPTSVWKDKTQTVCYHKSSFDKWTNQVSYWYLTPKSLGGGYFPKSTPTEDINESNFKELKKDSSCEDVRYVTIYSTTETVRETASMDFDRWCKLSPVDITELPLAQCESVKKSIKVPTTEVSAK